MSGGSAAPKNPCGKHGRNGPPPPVLARESVDPVVRAAAAAKRTTRLLLRQMGLELRPGSLDGLRALLGKKAAQHRHVPLPGTAHQIHAADEAAVSQQGAGKERAARTKDVSLRYADNYVTTAKYTFITFLPIFLFELFSRIAYLYFLAQAALSFWSVVSPFSPFGQTAALVFVMLASGIRAVIEDYRRHQQDAYTNNSITHVVGPSGVVHDVKWSSLRVGQLVCVRDGEALPADLLCLATSQPDNGPDGVAFVRTVNLDGETNLKTRRPILSLRHDETQPDACSTYSESSYTASSATGSVDGCDDQEEEDPGLQSSICKVLDLQGVLTCELPSRNMHRFEGSLQLLPGEGIASQATEPLPPPIPVTMNEMLLRGSLLSNTRWVLGLVVYAGPDTRIQMNMARPPFKAGSLDKVLNRQITVLIIFQVLASVATGFASWWWRQHHGVDRPHLALDVDVQGNWGPAGIYIILISLTAWILYSYLVPISLFVTMEIVKYAQSAVFISRDPRLSGYVGGGGPSTGMPKENGQARNSSLNEDLGRVSFVFSDKTGTLTQNDMRLRQLSLKGHIVGQPPSSFRLEEHTELAPGKDTLQAWDADLAAALQQAVSTPAWQHTMNYGTQAIHMQQGSKASQLGNMQQVAAGGTGSAGKDTACDMLDLMLAVLVCNSIILEPVVPTHKEDHHHHHHHRRRHQHRHDDAEVGGEEGEGSRNAEGKQKERWGGEAGWFPGIHRKRRHRRHDDEPVLQTTDTHDAFDSALPTVGPQVQVELAPAGHNATVPAGHTPTVSMLPGQVNENGASAQGLDNGPMQQGAMQGVTGSERQAADETPAADQPPALVNYQGPSPDEVALLEGARRLGFELISRTRAGTGNSNSNKPVQAGEGNESMGAANNNGPMQAHLDNSHTAVPDKPAGNNNNGSVDELRLGILGKQVSVHLLNLLEFNSDRKRMSVVVRMPGGELLAYVKGADNVMLPLLREDTPEELLEETHRDLSQFATQGLRTLVVGRRRLDPAWYTEWDAKYQQAAAALENREDLVNECAIQLEQQLQLLGVTAIEDRLQEGVPEAIAQLLACGMKVWMITGDKRETAINIAVSCALFSHSHPLLTLTAEDPEGASARIDELLSSTSDSDSSQIQPPTTPSPLPTPTQPPSQLKPEVVKGPGAVAEGQEQQLVMQQSDVQLLPTGAPTSTAAGAAAAGSTHFNPAANAPTQIINATDAPIHIVNAANTATAGSSSGQVASNGNVASHVGAISSYSMDSPAGQGSHGMPGAGYGGAAPRPVLNDAMIAPVDSAASNAASGNRLQLVVDGKALNFVLADPDMKHRLALLCSRCSSVLVCRASPAQKAAMLKMMREHAKQGGLDRPGMHTAPQRGLRAWFSRQAWCFLLCCWWHPRRQKQLPVLLAIGDGANDVAMLQAADVGVGLLGREGRQAANCADYVLPQFKCLVPLLLVHGTLCRQRLARLATYSFYKNVVFWAVLFCFQPFCGWSGQAVVDDISASVYNVVFTSLPILLYALMDRRATDEDLLTHPELYLPQEPPVRLRRFWLEGVGLGMVHGAIAFFVPFLGALGPDGVKPTWSLFFLSKCVYTAMLGAVTLEMAATTHYWTRVSAVITFLSFALVFPFFAVLPPFERIFRYWDNTYLTLLPQPLFQCALYWASVIAVMVLVLGVRLLWLGVSWLWLPDLSMRLAQARVYKGKKLEQLAQA